MPLPDFDYVRDETDLTQVDSLYESLRPPRHAIASHAMSGTTTDEVEIPVQWREGTVARLIVERTGGGAVAWDVELVQQSGVSGGGVDSLALATGVDPRADILGDIPYENHDNPRKNSLYLQITGTAGQTFDIDIVYKRVS